MLSNDLLYFIKIDGALIVMNYFHLEAMTYSKLFYILITINYYKFSVYVNIKVGSF